MAYSIFAFLFTLIELGVASVGYGMHSELIFYNAVVYGSPFYLIQHAFDGNSLWHEKNPLYWAFFLFHLIKYLCIFQAQVREDRNIIRTLALLFEAIYLSLSAYYLFP